MNPIEEAQAYKRLLNEFELKQDEVAERVSKSRAAVTNSLRLLKLSERVQQMVIDEMITTGHARALLPLESIEDMELAANRIIARSLSVRETESLVKNLLAKQNEEDQVDLNSESGMERLTRLHMKELERRSRETLGRRVRITNTGKKKTIELTFEDNEDLESILRTLCGNDFFSSENF